MTREELKDLIPRSDGQERGGGVAPLAPRWEGRVAVLSRGTPRCRRRSCRSSRLFHKVVMIRDRCAWLEQKINANPS